MGGPRQFSGKVFQGGPVQLDSALGLAVVPGDAPAPSGVRRLFGSVALVDLDAQPSLVVPAVAGLRIFAGYAGWSPGQLEDEIRTGSWFVVDSESGDVFTDEPAGLWQRVLRRQGDPLRWVALVPARPVAELTPLLDGVRIQNLPAHEPGGLLRRQARLIRTVAVGISDAVHDLVEDVAGRALTEEVGGC